MNTTNAIAKRFREVIFDGKWIANTNYMEQLNGLDWLLATKTDGKHNTIAALAQHIHYYIRGVADALINGKIEIRDAYSFDFPPIQTQENWEQILEIFWRDAEDFALLVEQLSDEQLTQHFIDERYGSIQRNLDGMIEHAYYHLGQIVLIKKMVSEE